MSTQTSVWVMIATDSVADKIRDLVDSGYFAEAKDLDYHLKAISEKISKLISDKGGSVKLSIYDRQIIELPVTIAEELPLIVAGYREVFGSLMAVGMGMDLKEASVAAQKATFTNQIELYDPKDESYSSLNKTLQLEADLFQPQPNINGTDQENHPGSPAPDAYKFSVGKVVPALTADQQMQSEAQMVNATVQMLMGPTNELQQQQQAQQEQEQKEQNPPGSLLEAMSGEKKTDKPKTETKQKKEDSDSEEDSKSKKKDKDSDSDDDSDDSDSDATNEKLGKLLTSVQEKMPELMKLHEKNPEAFKKVIALVQKLVDVAKSKKSSVVKTEISDMTEDLNKALRLTLPPGTVRNRKKKVIVDGKAKWRGMIAGQVKDGKGNPISVDSHNAHAEEGKEGKASEGANG